MKTHTEEEKELRNKLVRWEFIYVVEHYAKYPTKSIHVLCPLSILFSVFPISCSKKKFIAKMSTRKRSIERPEEDVVAVPLKKTKKEKEPEIEENESDEENEEVEDFGVGKMTVPKIKEMLKERDLYRLSCVPIHHFLIWLCKTKKRVSERTARY
jgi:hypothetical protein